jgi:alcohol dehydrogenase, propanol-preferring
MGSLLGRYRRATNKNYRQGVYTNLKPDDNVVIVGTGGLGLMAIQLVKAVTGANIIALDLDDAKLKVAKKNGADIINSKKGDPAKAVMELTDKLGADAIIDFVSPKNLVFEI